MVPNDRLDNPCAQGDDSPAPGFLHVIFHGLFCFFERPEDILVRVPRVEAHSVMAGMDNAAAPNAPVNQAPAGQPPPAPVLEHAYLAGNWLGEQTFFPGNYVLEGVHPGHAHFDKAQNLVLNGVGPARNPGHDLYADMLFPYPDQIFSLQRVKLTPDRNFDGNSKDRVAVTEVATLQVFTYRFDDNDNLRLRESKAGNHPWPSNDYYANGFRTLQIYSEPDRRIDAASGHVSHAFEATMKMFEDAQGGPLDLRLINAPIVCGVRQRDLPFGTIFPEMLDLYKQRDLASKAAVRRMINQDLNGVFDPDGTNSDDLQRCGATVGA